MANNPSTRRVKMIASTYIKSVVQEVGAELTLPSLLASEFVGNGRAIYLDPSHNDVASPPAADTNPSTDVHPLVSGGPAPSQHSKGKSYA